jgi:AmmeMemoRadiSam system protein A
LPRPVWLEEPAATFVTLDLHGELRGCIGSLEARRSLYDDVTRNAHGAAFDDPRFLPLRADELTGVDIEVSVLTAPQPLPFTSEADALSRLRRGIDGVIFQYAGRRATLLPQVWEQLPDPREFLRHLKMKAGLPADLLAEGVELSVYQVERFAATRS